MSPYPSAGGRGEHRWKKLPNRRIHHPRPYAALKRANWRPFRLWLVQPPVELGTQGLFVQGR
jgi:hypothetical protein